MKLSIKTVIPDYVQRMVAATNGRMYCDRLGKLKSYPIPKLPFKNAGSSGYFLDIGCGWGRWMVAAANDGYTPIGVDLKWEAAVAAKRVLEDQQVRGHLVVCDLDHLPFKKETVHVVWSYSVIQHVHRRKADQCFAEIARVLKIKGICFLEFPMKTGLWNKIVQLRRSENEDDVDSWCVRYYTVQELSDKLNRLFKNVESRVHCFFGIGIQPTDLNFVSIKFHPQIYGSIFLTFLSRYFPRLKWIADSVYFKGEKKES